MIARPSFRVRPLIACRLASLKDVTYDGAIASLGFETRSRQIPEALVPPAERAVIAFNDRQELDFAKNKAWFKDNGWQSVAMADQETSQEIVKWASKWLRRLCSERSAPVRVAIDISSMSRLRIAAVVEAALSLSRGARLEVDLLYTPAEFVAPDHEHEPLVFDIAPVSDYFAGWWADLDTPLFALIGVGFEFEMAASAIDKLEPEQTIVYRPKGEDSQYVSEIERANRALMRTKGVVSQQVLYDTADPFRCFSEIEARLSELGREYRVALVPLGPKIFAACVMLASILHTETSQVIRVTAGTRQRAQNRVSNGNVFGLRVAVDPSSRP